MGVCVCVPQNEHQLIAAEFIFRTMISVVDSHPKQSRFSPKVIDDMIMHDLENGVKK
jgi:hypothetical protein